MSNEATLLDQAYIDLVGKRPPLPNNWEKAYDMLCKCSFNQWMDKLGPDRSIRVLAHMSLNAMPPDTESYTRKADYVHTISEFIRWTLQKIIHVNVSE